MTGQSSQRRSDNTGKQHLMLRLTDRWVFVTAGLINLAWEVAQSPFYTGARAPFHLLSCTVASVVDAAVIWLIYRWRAARRGDPAWLRSPKVADLLGTLGAGLVIAVLFEAAARMLGWWDYAPAMPLVPLLRVGLFPFLQLAVTALLTFGLVGRWERRRWARCQG
jgi:hypothetical protein